MLPAGSDKPRVLRQTKFYLERPRYFSFQEENMFSIPPFGCKEVAADITTSYTPALV